jgi:ammonium transporter Rh
MLWEIWYWLMYFARIYTGTLTIHMFGAYFGLSISRMLGPPKNASVHNATPNAVSDIMSLIGTTLLWVYWPSFVGATETAVDSNENYCVIHTVLALLGSTVATFYTSHKLKHGLLDPVHIANSTLAGGVAVGASARLNMTPAGALLLGMIVGCVSVYGYVHVTPYLEEKCVLYDTCGVHNLHGMPSIVGGLASIIFVTINSDAEFLFHESSIVQALCQISAVFATVGFAILTGGITGKVMVLAAGDAPYKDTHPMKLEYDDAVWWEGEYFKSIDIFDAADNTNMDMHMNKHPDETTPLVL